MTRKYQVSVILINYNSSAYTLDCVRSIIEKTDSSIRYQIVVVDNHSREDEVVKLSPLEGNEKVTLFRNSMNAGFSGANMEGVRLSDADYYYFLNNDCVLLNDCLSILTAFMEQTPKAANCSGEMYIADGTYEYNFRYFPSLALKTFGSGILRVFNPSSYPSRHERFKVPTPVDLVNGSSMFIRAIPFDKIGGFDTTYFLYCEEEDIALRLKRHGFLTYLVPEAHYQHFISKSSTGGALNFSYLREFHISLIYYFSKNYNPVYKLLMQVFYFFKLIRKFYKDRRYVSLAFFVLKGAPMKESLRYKQTA